jgi:Zn-dependent M28 family amino/carboxypeptidase
MKKKPFLPLTIIFLVLLSFSAMAQRPGKDLNYLKYCLKTLASDSMGGRAPGTPYDLLAAEFIAGEFQKLKISSFQENSYFQEFSYTKDSATLKTRNVIALINNKAAGTIVIGAHYDHLGFGGMRSRSYGKHDVHNGADDNASGVALMLALAKQIRNQDLKNFNFIFISFSGHEDGLFGSEYFVKNNIVADSNIKLMINLDMVGRAEKVDPTVFVAGNDTYLLQSFKAIAGKPLHIKTGDKEMALGDHSGFAARNIPVLFLTTGMEDDYHKVTDDESLINYKAMLAIDKLILNFLKKINSGK